MTASPGRIFAWIYYIQTRRVEKKAFDITYSALSQSYIFRVIASSRNIYASAKSVMRCVWFTLWAWFFSAQCKNLFISVSRRMFCKMFENLCEKKWRPTEEEQEAGKKLPQIQSSIICLMTFTSSATFSISCFRPFLKCMHFAYNKLPCSQSVCAWVLFVVSCARASDLHTFDAFACVVNIKILVVAEGLQINISKISISPKTKTNIHARINTENKHACEYCCYSTYRCSNDRIPRSIELQFFYRQNKLNENKING